MKNKKFTQIVITLQSIIISWHMVEHLTKRPYNIFQMQTIFHIQ